MKRYLLLFFCIQAVLFSSAQKNNLDYFVSQALASSPLLKGYEYQLSSLSLDSMILRASLKTQVNFVSNNSYAPVIKGWGYDEVITNGQQISALASANRVLFNKNNVNAQMAGFQLQGEMARNNRRITELDIRRTIAEQYITVYGEQLSLEFNDHINEMLRREDSMLKKLTQDNVFKQAEYLSFVVTRQQQLLNTSQLRIQYAYDFAGLNYLSGVVDTAIFVLAEPVFNSIPAETAFHSSFFKQFELDSLKLVNDRSIIDVGYLPKVNIFGDGGYNSSLAYRAYRNFGTSVGVNITVPIYDGKQKKLKYSRLAIEERTIQFNKDVFTRQREQQLFQLRQQLRQTEEQIDLINKQVKYIETLITVNERLLATGDIRLTDFILALNNYFNAKNLVTQNYVSRLKILNQLSYWEK